MHYCSVHEEIVDLSHFWDVKYVRTHEYDVVMTAAVCKAVLKECKQEKIMFVAKLVVKFGGNICRTHTQRHTTTISFKSS